MAMCVAGEEKIPLKVKSLKSRKKYKNIKNINEPMQLNKRQKLWKRTSRKECVGWHWY